MISESTSITRTEPLSADMTLRSLIHAIEEGFAEERRRLEEERRKQREESLRTARYRHD